MAKPFSLKICDQIFIIRKRFPFQVNFSVFISAAMKKILFLIATLSLILGICTPNPEGSPEIG